MVPHTQPERKDMGSTLLLWLLLPNRSFIFCFMYNGSIGKRLNGSTTIQQMELKDNHN